MSDMSRGLGRTEQRILEYLDEKAKRSKVSEMKTVESYASTSEIGERLVISSDCVCQVSQCTYENRANKDLSKWKKTESILRFTYSAAGHSRRSFEYRGDHSKYQ